jgi:hypothetical protein
MMENIKNLISNCPDVANYLKEKMSEELINSLENNKNKDVPEYFIEKIKQRVIDDEKLCILIKNNPHNFFYYLDESKIIIDISNDSNGKFIYTIEDVVKSTPFDKRKDAELEALIVAIDLFQKILSHDINNIEVKH